MMVCGDKVSHTKTAYGAGIHMNHNRAPSLVKSVKKALLELCIYPKTLTAYNSALDIFSQRRYDNSN